MLTLNRHSMCRYFLGPILLVSPFASSDVYGQASPKVNFEKQLQNVRQAAIGQAAGFRRRRREWRRFLVLLKDEDAKIRDSAVRGLREFVLEVDRVRDALRAVLANQKEEDFVRRQAIKSLLKCNRFRSWTGASCVGWKIVDWRQRTAAFS